MSIELFKLVDGKLTPSVVSFFSYPGGEYSVKFNDGDLKDNEVAYVRGADPIDYVKLGLWGNEVRNTGGKSQAIIPYLPAARADHEEGHFDVHFYMNLISMAGMDRVICFDPHSDISTRILWNGGNDVVSVDPSNLIRTSLGLQTWHHSEHDDYRAKMTVEPLVGVIIPDKGAKDRATNAATALGLKTYQAEKHRDFKTGKLSGFSCEDLPSEGGLLVVDDICDGGGTFLGLAEAIGLSRDRLALWVSHGIFSQGMGKLFSKYGKIVTTDSHPGAIDRVDQWGNDDKLTVLPILYHLAEYLEK